MIFVECKPDVELVKIFGLSRREIFHIGPKPEICKRLRRFKKSESTGG